MVRQKPLERKRGRVLVGQRQGWIDVIAFRIQHIDKAVVPRIFSCQTKQNRALVIERLVDVDLGIPQASAADGAANLVAWTVGWEFRDDIDDAA